MQYADKFNHPSSDFIALSPSGSPDKKYLLEGASRWRVIR